MYPLRIMIIRQTETCVVKIYNIIYTSQNYVKYTCKEDNKKSQWLN